MPATMGVSTPTLVKHMLALSRDELARVPLEEMTLCAQWYSAARQQDPTRAPDESVRNMIERWSQTAGVTSDDTEGQRQQPMLRELLRWCATGGVKEMARDELDFLSAAWTLARSAKNQAKFKRAAFHIAAHIEEIEARRATMPMSMGMPNLSRRMAITTSEQLRHAEPREEASFGGVLMAVQGPLYEHRGNLKIVDGIPAECVVNVENGSCYVRGPVHGKLSAADSCEIAGDVTGVVIARRGDARARSLAEGCTVIAKEGDIQCAGLDAPELAFAGRTLRVRRNAAAGLCLADVVKIGGAVRGGEYHVAGRMQAEFLAPGNTLPLNIVMRRGLGCQDYNEALNPDAQKLMAGALKLRQRITALRDREAIYAREADEMAGNVLLFLLGELDMTEQVEQIEKLRRRMNYLDRLDSAVRALTRAIEDRLAAEEGRRPHPDTPFRAFGNDERRVLHELEEDLNALEMEGPVERQLRDCKEQVAALGARIFRKMLTRQKVLDALQGLLRSHAEIADLRARAAQTVVEREHALAASMRRVAILDRARDECARVEILEQLLGATRSRAGMAAFQSRIGHRVVELMQRNIEARLSRAAECQQAAVPVQGQLRKTRTQLWDEHGVSMPRYLLDDEMPEGAQVRGIFAEGVRLLAYKHLVDVPGGTGVLVTEDSKGTLQVYRRSAGGGIELVTE